jgi:hypothetical protein
MVDNPVWEICERVASAEKDTSDCGKVQGRVKRMCKSCPSVTVIGRRGHHSHHFHRKLNYRHILVL